MTALIDMYDALSAVADDLSEMLASPCFAPLLAKLTELTNTSCAEFTTLLAEFQGALVKLESWRAAVTDGSVSVRRTERLRICCGCGAAHAWHIYWRTAVHKCGDNTARAALMRRSRNLTLFRTLPRTLSGAPRRRTDTVAARRDNRTP